MNSLTQRAKRVLSPTSLEPLGLEVERADGVYLFDPNGKKYIDLISGISVSNIGHGNSVVKHAIVDQLEKNAHVMVYGEMMLPTQVEFAEYLTSLLPKGLDSVYFVNSGSEAVEGAMKLAKRFTGRQNILSLNKAYHGSSHGALSLMGDEYFKAPFRPLLPGISQIEANSIDDLSFIDENTAAVFMEPIQGEAGINILTKEYLMAASQRCKEVGALLVFDEIQTGIGRTGPLFNFQLIDVVPDVLLTSKALGGGLPLGAFISSTEIMSCFAEDPVLGHITTFGGNPICCVAANAALKFLVESKLMDEVPSKETLIRQKLQHAEILEIRGTGLLLAAQFKSAKFLQSVIDRAIELGVVTDWFLFCDSAMRIAPPLTITMNELENACDIIIQAINDQA
jgi:acetylornithine/N-succinyldiaminopimelate aminotransferase